MDQEAVDLLTATRNRIKGGWVQGLFYQSINQRKWLFWIDTKISYCLVGALQYDFTSREIYRRAELYLSQAIGTKNIMNWNDTPGRTKKQVLDALYVAIELARTKPFQRNIEAEVKEYVNSIPTQYDDPAPELQKDLELIK